MRLSIIETDRGYDPRAHFRAVRVMLDGVQVPKPLTADEELGEVLCFKLNARGNPFIDPDNPKQIAQHTLTGKVEIVLPDNWEG